MLRLAGACALAFSLSAQISREEDLTAALILSFARFTEWPPASTDTPLVIGVAADQELLQSLLRLTAGKSDQGRPLQVRGLRQLNDVRLCHFLYFGPMDAKKLEEYLTAARAGSVLTMGESPRFLSSGGIIHLFQEDGRFNFAVHLGNLSQSHLNISSKLLRLGYTQRTNSSQRERP